jgi:hypothetical protein
VTVLGLGEVLANLARVAAQIEVATPIALEHGAEVVRDAWVANIEADDLVLTGRYRDSVSVVEADGSVAVKTDVPYASILEEGDSRQAGHHVAQRAAEEHGDDVVDRVGHELGEVIR